MSSQTYVIKLNIFSLDIRDGERAALESMYISDCFVFRDIEILLPFFHLDVHFSSLFFHFKY